MTLKMLAYLFVSGFYTYLAIFWEKKIEWMDGGADIRWKSTLQTENVVGLIAWKAMNLVLVQSQTKQIYEVLDVGLFNCVRGTWTWWTVNFSISNFFLIVKIIELIGYQNCNLR